MLLRSNSHLQPELSAIASLVSVRDVFTPFVATFDGHSKVTYVWEEWMEIASERSQSELDQLALVMVDNKPVGTLSYDALENHKKHIMECMDPIDINILITVNTSLMEVVEMFAKTHYYYFIVIDGNELVGWLSYNDLFKLPFKLALFAQLLAIESKMIIAAQKDPEASFNLLSIGRQKKAYEIFKKRQGAHLNKQEPSFQYLITCTCLIDKFTMLFKNHELLDAVPSIKMKKLHKKFETIRNALAHPNPEDLLHVLLNRGQFGDFCRWLLNLNAELSEFLEEGVESI